MLIEPTRIYVDIVRKLMRDLPVKGMVHITGGGFFDNIPRVLPRAVTAEIQFGSWQMLPVFNWLREQGQLSWDEMLQIFNCSIGYVLIVEPDVAEEVMSRLHAQKEPAWVIGRIDRRSGDSEQVNIIY